MNPKFALVRQLLPGLLPLIIFIAVDEIWGTKAGLIVAVVIGGIELTYGLLRGKGIDKFVLLDLALIMTMGGISLWLEDDFFFKLKPVIIGGMMCVMLGVAAFLPGNWLLDMSKRYFKDIQMDPWKQLEFKKGMRVFFYLLVIYTLLTLTVTLYGTTREWGLIGGPGIFLLLGIYLIIEVLRKRNDARAYAKEEWLPLVDEEGRVLGQAPRSVVHDNSFLLHPVVHCHVFCNGRIYLQKRSTKKAIQPGKWDTAVGGHIGVGESVEISLKREAQEEIGMTDFKAQLVNRYVWESPVERELIFMFVSEYNKMLAPDPVEVDEGKFWSLSEIKENLYKDVFTPNFEKEFQFLLKLGVE